MNSKELISKSFKDFKNRINDLIRFYGDKTINLETLQLNLNEDLYDLEDTIKLLVNKIEDQNHDL